MGTLINISHNLKNMKITITEDCIGCGTCEALCPKIFKVVDGIAMVIKEPEEADKCVKEAAEACPVEAIKIKE